MFGLNREYQITELKKKVIWCIFLYEKDEDPTELSGQHPLYYNSYEEMMHFLDSNAGKTDFAEWREKNYKIVTRPIELYLTEERV